MKKIVYIALFLSAWHSLYGVEPLPPASYQEAPDPDLTSMLAHGAERILGLKRGTTFDLYEKGLGLFNLIYPYYGMASNIHRGYKVLGAGQYNPKAYSWKWWTKNISDVGQLYNLANILYSRGNVSKVQLAYLITSVALQLLNTAKTKTNELYTIRQDIATTEKTINDIEAIVNDEKLFEDIKKATLQSLIDSKIKTKFNGIYRDKLAKIESTQDLTDQDKIKQIGDAEREARESATLSPQSLTNLKNAFKTVFKKYSTKPLSTLASLPLEGTEDIPSFAPHFVYFAQLYVAQHQESLKKQLSNLLGKVSFGFWGSKNKPAVQAPK